MIYTTTIHTSSSKIYKATHKVVDVIHSCKTIDQFEIAMNMVDLFEKKFKQVFPEIIYKSSKFYKPIQTIK